jgi:lactobin A/cerein 7B family class IIb bacteriocin
MRLSNSELCNVTGGISVWAALGIVAGLIFGVGAVDGYARPYRCR